jgi:hypothetical protein
VDGGIIDRLLMLLICLSSNFIEDLNVWDTGSVEDWIIEDIGIDRTDFWLGAAKWTPEKLYF